ncbi:methylmalonyl-CoA mutase family protein [Micropruina sonneratiae]|uniref:methylmalonyl-CoA mutase family protein n=1 Tax=Micropruina sonneratiae TaxID=2986940 RepID=UPI002226BFFA|nr:methylmalonyl-CoA mutase family protein [Micropruina sp. KQZ13P-5]MCW3158159.1 methylmalonyl-CoA mutase family protein [Micropruina sp. KQZ13P-5]
MRSSPVRIVTAAALFDGHDAAITVIRRVLQSRGAEVIHLGHDRSVEEVVTAAVDEDADGVAVSSYQGGHLEYFGYLVDRLAERGSPAKVFGGGGGVIVADEIAALASRGVMIYSPAEGQRLGLTGMADEVIAACRGVQRSKLDAEPAGASLPRTITLLAQGRRLDLPDARPPVLGITGTGGSGKSSLTDELLLRFRRRAPHLRIAVLAIDPTARRGGALLGDRIRMNALGGVYFRSLATRGAPGGVPVGLDEMIAACGAAGHDLVIVETPGMGQGDAAIADHADLVLYVMTPEYGAATQLEKIAALEVADLVAINKFDRRGAEDALRDVARQLIRARGAFGQRWQDQPVLGTVASRVNDDGVNRLFDRLLGLLADAGVPAGQPDEASTTPGSSTTTPGETGTGAPAAPAGSPTQSIIPRGRERYLAEVADAVRDYHAQTTDLVEQVRRHDHLEAVAALLDDPGVLAGHRAPLPRAAADLLDAWRAAGADPGPIAETLSGLSLPKVAVPSDPETGALVRYLREENRPGAFPFTAGVFPLKRSGERPTRMFAGEGDPARTNRRFHLLAKDQPSTRLSTAFDSVTLYGRDPDRRPDIYGKVGTSGVSIATLDDMKDTFAGFDLADPKTSVSMTINGPAPTILAMFFNAAIDAAGDPEVVRRVRGTVQADILKEDQGQNTCLFSTDFSLRAMADVQEWFIEHGVKGFYSVSISGYHIAEAGANPITQLALTLANGFTYVEAYLARGMAIDDFAPNLSFFFSNGMDAEYSVIGRVARRIWAVALRERYGAGERAQKLKYHIQTSGRSLHAAEMEFNDIRTTLQALCAFYDSANSLHTNAYDEAVTTPSPASVRRALAIQLIIDAEWGLAAVDNPLQGSYLIEQLTALVEEAVLAEFDRLADRGGVLGAMETGYQRGLIQDESMLYESRKHDGSMPIIGVNTFLNPDAEASAPTVLARGTTEEKESQLARLADFHARHAAEAPKALERLKRVALSGGNVFDELMRTVRVASLGQISEAFFEVGGRYRRTM